MLRSRKVDPASGQAWKTLGRSSRCSNLQTTNVRSLMIPHLKSLPEIKKTIPYVWPAKPDQSVGILIGMKQPSQPVRFPDGCCSPALAVRQTFRADVNLDLKMASLRRSSYTRNAVHVSYRIR